MKHYIISFVTLLMILGFSNCAAPIDKNYKLTLIENYHFRRSYVDSEHLSDIEFDSLKTTNPDCYTDCQTKKLYAELVKSKIIDNNTLNFTELEKLTISTSIYHLSKKQFFDVEIEYIEYCKELEKPLYILTFKDKNKVVLSDTLKFEFPPDVTFSVMDINQDGKDEIYLLHEHYIMNGDNFELLIYEIEL